MPRDYGHRYALISDLNAEWAQLADLHRPTVDAWARQHSALTNCRELGDVLGAIRAAPDAVLNVLLAAAAAGDSLAGRIVLQAMLGKVVRLAQAHPDVGVGDFVSALWCRIQTYPLARRPVKIAANLALDARKDALAGRRMSPWELSSGLLDRGWGLHAHLGPEQLLILDPPEAAHEEADRVLETACRLRLIDNVTAAMLRSVYVDGSSSRSAAAHHHTSPELVRYRCSRALRHLARHADALAAA
jgi:hypothetical protein